MEDRAILNMIERTQKVRRLEVLQVIQTGARTREWFEGIVPFTDLHKEERGKATRELVQSGLVEKDENYPAPNHPHPYRLTTKGITFLEDMRRQIGKENGIHWNRVKEIEFPLS